MSRPDELPTRNVACANCGKHHSNTALCDRCAMMVALPCAWDGIEGCDCRSCRVAARACGALAEVLSDLNVYSLREVRRARVELAATPVVALPHEAAFAPEVNDVDPVHAYDDGCECEHCDSHRAELDAFVDEAFAPFTVDADDAPARRSEVA